MERAGGRVRRRRAHGLRPSRRRRASSGRRAPTTWPSRSCASCCAATREIPPERIGDVIYAATAQVGDQGLTLGRDVALLAGIPQSVPGFAVDRMCAGALTAVTAGAGEIAYGACDIVLAGGVEHMGHHPMGEDVDFNPRFVAERLVDTSAVTMGATAENLHDRFPQITKDDADAFAVRVPAARRGRVVERRHARDGRADERLHGRRLERRRPRRVPPPRHDARGARRRCVRRSARAAELPPATRPGSPTAQPPCFLAAEETAAELGLEPQMRLVAFAFAGVEPELMGIGPIPATRRVLEQTGLTLDDIGLFELNEPFAVQVLTWCDGMGVDPEDPRLNPYGGAIACGHPLAATGVRLMAQLAYGFRERPDVRYGLTALCIGMGMGAALLWENLLAPVTEFKLDARGRRRARDDRQRRGLDEADVLRAGRARVARSSARRARGRGLRAAVITGKPFVFAAGADITEFPDITRRARASQARARGHELFGAAPRAAVPDGRRDQRRLPRRRSRARVALHGANDLDRRAPLRVSRRSSSGSSPRGAARSFSRGSSGRRPRSR